MKHPQRLSALIGASAIALLAACNGDNEKTTTTATTADVAPGAPGAAPIWAYSGKTGIGTSYERYHNGQFSDDADTGKVSKVWFSLAQGIVTETMYGLIHQAQIKDMEFVIEGPDFVDTERLDTNTQIEYLHTDAAGRPLSLAYRVTNTDKDGHYTIVKDIVTDPGRQSLVMRVRFEAHTDGLTPHLVVNPHMANTGVKDKAWVEGDYGYASEGDTALAVTVNTAVQGSAGFVGESDLVTDLADGQLDRRYQSTGEKTGNVNLSLSLPTLNSESAEWELGLGFGESTEAARTQIDASLEEGFQRVAARYQGEGDAIGWEDYLADLDALPALRQTATDGGALTHASALVLKAQEDKTHAGALIASLSNPWGDDTPALESSTGYKAVWPRDFYQVAMAFLAMGDTETPLVAFRYLEQIQVGPQVPGYTGEPGWFLQKTHVDGTLEWFSVQLDQTAMPIMLGWRLWQEGVLNDEEAKQWYQDMLRPAADFLADGGQINLDWNQTTIDPPYTQQERWEEQEGHSPSTTAAVIAGLVSAAELAELAADPERAGHYLAQADAFEADLEARTFTTDGALATEGSDGRYYLRINRDNDPNDRGTLIARNGQGELNESEIVDPGFLELVRYGVRAADDQAVRASLAEVDSQELPEYLQVRYTFDKGGKTFSGWRRYGGDGYGERTSNGGPYGQYEQMQSDQRGRVWPFLTGERGHYELAHGLQTGTADTAALAADYAGALEAFANTGLMLPEQVWDGVGANDIYGFEKGEGTNSATPLAWTHAEYIKLLRSLGDGAVWDRYGPVAERYQD